MPSKCLQTQCAQNRRTFDTTHCWTEKILSETVTGANRHKNRQTHKQTDTQNNTRTVLKQYLYFVKYYRSALTETTKAVLVCRTRSWCFFRTFSNSFGPQQMKNTPTIISNIRMSYTAHTNTFNNSRQLYVDIFIGVAEHDNVRF